MISILLFLFLILILILVFDNNHLKKNMENYEMNKYEKKGGYQISNDWKSIIHYDLYRL